MEIETVSSEPTFTFTWKVKNFTYWYCHGEKNLSGPVFSIHALYGTKWRVDLESNSVDQPDDIHIYLSKLPSKMSVTISYEFGIITSNGTCVNKDKAYRQTFERAQNGFGFENFIQRSKLYGNKKLYIPKRALTIQLKIWSTENKESATSAIRSDVPMNLCTGSTLINAIDLKHSYIDRLSEEDFVSFFICRESTKLHCRLKLDAIEKKCLITISNINISKSFFALCNILVCDHSGIIQHTGWYEHFFIKDKDNTWIIKFTPNCYENCLTKIIKIKMTFALTTGSVHSQLEDWTLKSVTSKHNCGKSTLQKDFLSLYSSRELCDFNITSAEGKSLKAHKCVLSARSPVFKRMLDHDSKESIESTMNIEDIDYETLNQFLKFMYSSRMEDVDLQSTLKLYAAADKYELFDLRQFCWDTITDRLAVSNVFDILKLADMHSDSDLKKVIKMFLLHNGTAAFETDEWKYILETNSKLASEVMQWMVTTVSKKLESYLNCDENDEVEDHLVKV